MRVVIPLVKVYFDNQHKKERRKYKRIWGSVNYGPQPVFVHKVLLEQSHAYLFTYVYNGF